MQHSLIRTKNEEVKIFSHKDPQLVRKTLRIFSFTNRGLEEKTPSVLPVIEDLNIGYYSTVITTPNENCYLLILFCGNPIVLMVGNPTLQFIYWGKLNTDVHYKHFNEFGSLRSEGILNRLNYGFYYYTPIEDTLGYIEVNDTPYIINVPYSIVSAGIGIDIDWKRSIKRQVFGIEIKKINFDLNTKNPINFNLKSKKLNFKVESRKNKFEIKTNKLQFRVNCK